MSAPVPQKNVRIARNRRNGRKYIVQQIDFRTNFVHTWGEVVLYDTKRGTVKHDGQLSHHLCDMDIVEVPLTRELLDELFTHTKDVYAHELANGEVTLSEHTTRTRTKPAIA